MLSHEIHCMPQVIAAKKVSSQAPIKHIKNCSFLYTCHHNMYFVALKKSQVNPALVQHDEQHDFNLQIDG
jgi:hypothetical protein